MSTKYSYEQLVDMPFTQLMAITLHLLVDSGIEKYAGFKSNGDLVRYMSENGIRVSAVSLLNMLAEEGLLSESETSEEEEPYRPENDDRSSDEIANEALRNVVSNRTLEPPVQEDEIPVSDTEMDLVDQTIFILRNELGPIFAGDGFIRTSDGGYVCPFCVALKEKPYVGDSKRSVGSHSKIHDIKPPRDLYNQVMSRLEEYDTDTVPVIPVTETHPITQQALDKEGEDEPASTDSGHKIIDLSNLLSVQMPPESPTAPAEIKATEQYLSDPTQAIMQLANSLEYLQKDMEARLKSLEKNILTAVIVVSAMGDAQRKALYEQFAKSRVGILADILS